MIDFNKLAKKQTIITPISNNSFKYNRKLYTPKVEHSGFYKVELEGNNATIIEEVYPSVADLNKKNILQGYLYNENVLFKNFDNARKNYNFPIMVETKYNTLETFSPVYFYVDEMKRIFVVEFNYNDLLCQELKMKFDEDTDIKEMKGLTPELKTLYLFHNLERIKIQQEIEEARKKLELAKIQKEREELQKSIPARITAVIETVGATVKNITLRGKNEAIVEWKLNNDTFTSLIDINTFRVIRAGYCVSGHDRELSASSMVLLAENYQDDDLIVKMGI